jgi:hypothetical protein
VERLPPSAPDARVFTDALSFRVAPVRELAKIRQREILLARAARLIANRAFRDANMSRVITEHHLELENARFQGTGGVSAQARHSGFRPAFLDTQSETVYLSRFADGRPAPFHLLDGLPDELVISRSAGGRVAAVKTGVIAGFVLEGRFYTRGAAARRARRA